MIRMMTATFTSFASFDIPDNDEIRDQWTEVKSKDLPLTCLNINNNEIKMMPLPESERLQTWNEIFAKENVELY